MLLRRRRQVVILFVVVSVLNILFLIFQSKNKDCPSYDGRGQILSATHLRLTTGLRRAGGGDVIRNGSRYVSSAPPPYDVGSFQPDCDEECRQLSDLETRIDCRAIMDADPDAVSSAKAYMARRPRLVIPDRVHSAGGCSQFQESQFYPETAASEEELAFPIAFSIVAHRRPDQLERLIRAIYQPQNVYCIHVDAKADAKMDDFVRKLTECFANVFMTSRVKVVYGSFSRLQADLNCLADLLRRSECWTYVINLTGEEFPLKTNRELVKILKLYNGSNDIEGTSLKVTATFHTRYDHKWRMQGNIMIRDRHRPHSAPPMNITLVKGSAFGAFTRQFVEFVLTDSRVREFLVWLEHVWSPDELLWATVNSHLHNPHLCAPGGRDGLPEEKPWLAKYVAWSPRDQCAGKKVRNICIFSVGDLPTLKSRRELFANKFYLDYDYVVLHCLEQWLRGRASSAPDIDARLYQDVTAGKVKGGAPSTEHCRR